MSTYVIAYRPSPYLMHHGVQGQKWGVRKYQNSDGSLTAEGYRHYYGGNRKEMSRDERSAWRSSMNADRKAWKANTKYNLKDLKKQVREGTLSKDSKEYLQAKQDRMLAKHGSKKNIDLYRYGTKGEQEKAIKAAKAAKIGKTVTASVVGGSLGASAVASVGGLAVLGTIAVGNVLAGGALALMGAGTLGVAGVGLAGAKANAAKMSPEVNNIEKLAYMMGTKRVSPDGTMTTYGNGMTARTKVNKANPTMSKDQLIKDLKTDISRHQDVADQIQSGYRMPTAMYNLDQKTWMNEYSKRTDSIIDSLKMKGVSQKEIDGIIKDTIDSHPSLTKNLEYKYKDRSSYQNFDNNKQTSSWNDRYYKAWDDYLQSSKEMNERWQKELHNQK